MAKLTLSDVTNLTGNELSAIGTLNANWDLIEAALENTLSRDGTSPNSMTGDIDMNGQALLNVGAITTSAGAGIGISGPSTSTDNALPRWGDFQGATLQDSGWTLSDSDVMTAGASLNMGSNAITSVSALTLTGGGNIDLNFGAIKAHTQLTSQITSSSNAVTIDTDSGNYFYTTLTENISTVTFTVNAASGRLVEWYWEITQDAGGSAFTLTQPAAVVAPGGSIVLSTGANDVDVIKYWTRDGGTTIFAKIDKDYA